MHGHTLPKHAQTTGKTNYSFTSISTVTQAKGNDKGTALRALLDGHREDALRVYVGDDETDEDAFEVLLDGGVGIKVGPRGVPTKAHGRLESPEAVRAFLAVWIGVTTR